MTLIAIDGPPGTGKTTDIIEMAKDWPEPNAIITYTNDASNTVRLRAPNLNAGTIYSLTWPFVKPFSGGAGRQIRRTGAYNKRRIQGLMDPALFQYEAEAPSRQQVTVEGKLAPMLHSWGGPEFGEPPVDLSSLQPTKELRYVLPLARWVDAGAPVPDSARLEVMAIDEVQDVSSLELTAALALLKPGGTAYAYGDPGQAIFAHAKGITGSALPPAWERADENERLEGGFRVGDPVASAAARVLRSYFDRPSWTFMAGHETQIVDWDPSFQPARGLVLGYSRYSVAKQFKIWNLQGTAVTPTIAAANKELVLSTGHAAKGGEADDVYLLPWSQDALSKLDAHTPESVRLLYVMLTRAIKRLHIPRNLKIRILQ